MKLIGKRLGDYEIERLLGKGSMARVYRARENALHRVVAVKVLEEAIFTPGQKVKRFFRETAALSRLEHAHIVPIYTAGESAPYYFYAMRLMHGGSLADAMAHGVHPRLGYEWIRQICLGLSYAHRRGVIHRDLKPSNVLLHDGLALLSDFGLARLRDMTTITQEGMVLGTPLYMAPEQTAGEVVTAAGDCFAVGVILYELLVGAHPFSRGATGTISSEECERLFARIRGAEFARPSEVEPRVAPAIEEVILRALAVSPRDRYRNAAELLRDLELARGALGEFERSACTVASPWLETIIELDLEPDGATTPWLADTREDPPVKSRDAKTPIAGQVGRYLLLRELGSGGQGIVHEAHDPVLDRRVAVKVLLGGGAADRELSELFYHEARVSARLNHPHIIQIYDFGFDGGNPYITMQFVGGPSLESLIDRGETLPLRFALEVLLQTCEALEYAHREGVLHLDVKPANILLQPLERHFAPGGAARSELGVPHAVLTDFTMAMLRRTELEADADVRPGSEVYEGVHGAPHSMGTVSYASPERLSDGEAIVGPASDLFSLGVVFHEMLTGERLFGAGTPEVVRMRALHGEIPPPSHVVAAGLPPDVDALCARMLARRPDDRWQSASEVIARAEEIAARI